MLQGLVGFSAVKRTDDGNTVMLSDIFFSFCRGSSELEERRKGLNSGW
jgi:hypothetical protein